MGFVCACMLQLCPTLCDPWTIAQQAPLSIEFSRQKYWSGLPFSTPGDLPDPGIEPVSLMPPHWQADSLPAEPQGKLCVYFGDQYFVTCFVCMDT